MAAEFVVPTVGAAAVRPAEPHRRRGNRHQGVVRRRPGIAARRPGRVRRDVLASVLADQHRRSLQVDALVLDAHQDHHHGCSQPIGRASGRRRIN